jgi:hypothetical protein
MQDADAHHRRKRIRSPSVTRFPATLPSPRASGSSSASSSDQDAGRPMVQPQRGRSAAPPAEPARVRGRSCLRPVMTSNRLGARHELIRLPTISVRVVRKVRPGGCSAHAYHRGPSRGRSPICPGAGTLPRPPGRLPSVHTSPICHAPPSPSPICRARGRSPVPAHRVRALLTLVVIQARCALRFYTCHAVL